jgi:hypothetical protein
MVDLLVSQQSRHLGRRRREQGRGGRGCADGTARVREPCCWRVGHGARSRLTPSSRCPGLSATGGGRPDARPAGLPVVARDRSLEVAHASMTVRADHGHRRMHTGGKRRLGSRRQHGRAAASGSWSDKSDRECAQADRNPLRSRPTAWAPRPRPAAASMEGGTARWTHVRRVASPPRPVPRHRVSDDRHAAGAVPLSATTGSRHPVRCARAPWRTGSSQ